MFPLQRIQTMTELLVIIHLFIIHPMSDKNLCDGLARDSVSRKT
jgi:hypothetical protein